MIEIQEITSKKELKAFVRFPFSLYKNNLYWVPPIINDEVNSLDKTKNPVFDNAEAWFFIAKKNGEIVGRIAAIVNWIEINRQKIKKMRFGWFDVIDDVEVTKALLEKVNDIGRKHLLEFIEGPVGFSNLDKVGILTQGFDHIGTMITWYNHPYYKTHFEELGFQVEKKFLELYFLTENVDIENYSRMAQIIAKRYELRTLKFKKTSDVLPWVDEMFELFNTSYARLPSFVPITQKQIDYFKKKYISLINPDFIKFIVDKNDKLISFSITMPSFSKALQKANGKLFPFGLYHLLKARKKCDTAIFYLIGVLPEYQKKGVTAIIFNEFFKTYKKYGVKKAISTPELEENKDIQLIWKNFNPVYHKKRCTFKKNIS